MASRFRIFLANAMDTRIRILLVECAALANPRRVPRISRHLALPLVVGEVGKAATMTDPGSKPSRPTMWCRKCGYPLDGLSENRCPECGREFDPDNKRSYLSWPFRVGRTFSTAAAFSFVFAVLTAMLWVRSYYVVDHLSGGYWKYGGVFTSAIVTFGSSQGLCQFHFPANLGGPRTFVPGFHRGQFPQSRPVKLPTIPVSSSRIIVPHFVVVFLFLMLPFAWLYRWRRARRMRQ
jgi:hypothetical protein